MSFLHGQLLIASPYLSDRNFFRSVVLVVSHDAEHAFGLLLNRPNHESVSDVWESMTNQSCDCDTPVRTGGPLNGPLMVIHQNTKHADTQIAPNVQLSSTKDSIGALLSHNVEPLIPIVGYSGWGAGQLEVELEVGGWMTYPASEDIIFAPADNLWSMASARVSDSILSGADLRHVPQDPRWN